MSVTIQKSDVVFRTTEKVFLSYYIMVVCFLYTTSKNKFYFKGRPTLQVIIEEGQFNRHEY